MPSIALCIWVLNLLFELSIIKLLLFLLSVDWVASCCSSFWGGFPDSADTDLILLTAVFSLPMWKEYCSSESNYFFSWRVSRYYSFSTWSSFLLFSLLSVNFFINARFFCAADDPFFISNCIVAESLYSSSLIFLTCCHLNYFISTCYRLMLSESVIFHA